MRLYWAFGNTLEIAGLSIDSSKSAEKIGADSSKRFKEFPSAISRRPKRKTFPAWKITFAAAARHKGHSEKKWSHSLYSAPVENEVSSNS